MTGTNFTSAKLGSLLINTGRTLTVESFNLLGNTIVGNGAGFGKTLRFGGTVGTPTLFGDSVTGNGTVTIASDVNVAFDGVVSYGGLNWLVSVTSPATALTAVMGAGYVARTGISLPQLRGGLEQQLRFTSNAP